MSARRAGFRRQSRARHARGQRGYVLVTVLVAAFLIAAVAYLLSRSAAVDASLAGANLDHDRARYVAEAGVAHALWLARQSDCSAYPELANVDFGSDAYSVVPSPAEGSPIVLQATAQLSSGAAYTMASAPVRVFTTDSYDTQVLQPAASGIDTYIRDGANDSRNFGASEVLKLNNQSAEEAILIRFGLGPIPAGVEVISATLELWLRNGDALVDGQIDAHRVTQAWVEGSENGSAPVPGTGATYNSYDGQTNWANDGGDYASPASASTTIPNLTPGWHQWDLQTAVQDWVDGRYANEGVLLRASAGIVDKIEFASSDGTAEQHPRLTVVYACECGLTCASVEPPADLLFVAANPASLLTGEQARIDLFESWGYPVTLIDDSATQAEFDAAAAANGVIYVSEELDHSELGTKLRSTATGVVVEEQYLFQEFGFSGARSQKWRSEIEVVNNAHYITSPFAAGVLQVLTFDQALSMVINPTPDVDVLALVNNSGSDMQPGVATIDVGDELFGGGNAAGRRVKLPWGPIDVATLTDDGRLLTQRALVWASTPAGTFFELQVSDGNDDAEQLTGDGTMYLTSSDLEIADNLAATGQPTDIVGIRFAGLPIAQGETIGSARIQFQVDEVDSGPASLTIRGHAIDDAPAFSTSAFDISSRPLTAAAATWSPPEWTVIGERGENQRTVDIGAVLQEVVDRPGWTSGNAFAVVIGGSGTRTAEAYEGDPAGAPTLQVVFGGGGSPGGGGDGDGDGGGDIAGSYLDEFNAVAFDGNDGTLHWSAAWHELGESDGADTGRVRVMSSASQCAGGGCLRIGATEFSLTGRGLSRTANLGAATKAELTFTVADSGFGASVDLEISDDGGTTWTTLHTYSIGSDIGSTPAPQSFDITAYASTDTTIRFVGSGTPDDGAYLYIDEVRIDVSGSFFGGGGGGGGDGPVACDGNVRDEFNVQSFANNDGSLNWASAWLEINESNGWNAGDSKVVNDDSDFHLQVRDNDGGGEGVEREANLSAAATATLSFVYRRHAFDDSADFVTLDVSPDGGGTWVELDRFSGPGTDDAYGARSYDISAYRAANTRIRFLTSPDLGGGDELNIDNVDITLSGCVN